MFACLVLISSFTKGDYDIVSSQVADDDFFIELKLNTLFQEDRLRLCVDVLRCRSFCR